MGAVFRHPVVSSSFHEFAVWVEDNDYKVIGTSAHAEQEYQETTHFAKPLVLLLGDERRGLNSEHIAVCDTLLRLPMHGRVTSLNLAVAAGIMLYDILQKVDWGAN